jgi:hypothetical protein
MRSNGEITNKIYPCGKRDVSFLSNTWVEARYIERNPLRARPKKQ